MGRQLYLIAITWLPYQVSNEIIAIPSCSIQVTDTTNLTFLRCELHTLPKSSESMLEFCINHVWNYKIISLEVIHDTDRVTGTKELEVTGFEPVS